MLISNTAERLKQYMDENRMSQADIIRKCEPYCKKYDVKITSAHLSQWVKGKFAPKQDKLTIIGLALGLNEAWLMGYDVPKQRQHDSFEIKNNIETNHNTEYASEFIYDIDMINLWKSEVGEVQFSDKEIQEIMNYAKYIISKRGEN